MKSILLISCFILTSTIYAQDVAKPNSDSSPTSTKSSQFKELSAIDFFEVLHPDNKRDPNWPEKLTIKPVTSISQKNFEKEIKGRWRAVYHCGGKPINAQDGFYIFFDGIKYGYLEFIFTQNQWTRLEIDKKTLEKKESRHNDSAPVRFEFLGDGKFKIIFEKSENGEKYRDDIVNLMSIEETQEYGFEYAAWGTCPDGTKIKALFVPYKKEVS